jgi:lipid-A-disaccharide synthase
MYGAQLIEALHRLEPSLEFFGVGGERMRAAGCVTVVDAKDLSVVGITEILSHLPKIWGLFHRLIAEADKRKPHLAVVIDSPAFNWRVARQMKKRGIPVVYYVCPQFWAWRQGRVRLLRKYVDKALVIFPFEEKFYRDRGVDAEFVGHPLANLPRPAISRNEYAAEHGLDAAKPWITLMPGSRVKEVRMNLPGILESARLLDGAYEFILPVAPTLDSGLVQRLMGSHVSTGAGGGAGEGTCHSMDNAGSPCVHLVTEALPALAHSRAGIIASGTATVEAAMMETPFVMVYRVTPVTYLLGRSTVKVPHFAMVNLIAGQEVVPELVQRDFTPERVAAEVSKIIPDGEPREKMRDGLRRVRGLLRGDRQDAHPAERAARAVIELLPG